MDQPSGTEYIKGITSNLRNVVQNDKVDTVSVCILREINGHSSAPEGITTTKRQQLSAIQYKILSVPPLSDVSIVFHSKVSINMSRFFVGVTFALVLSNFNAPVNAFLSRPFRELQNIMGGGVDGKICCYTDSMGVLSQVLYRI